MNRINTNFLINIICYLQSRIEKLTAEKNTLAQEKVDLELIMEISGEHADETSMNNDAAKNNIYLNFKIN